MSKANISRAQVARHTPDEAPHEAEPHDGCGLPHFTGDFGDGFPGSAKERGPLPPKIGRRLRALRQKRGLTLAEVEAMCGISKSMLSQIERERVNPTFGTLWNLTRSLDVSIGELLEEVNLSRGETRSYEHVTVHSTPIIANADGLAKARILHPQRFPFPFEWYEMIIEPGGARRSNAHGNGAWEHCTCIIGEVVMEIGDTDVLLKAGETVRYSGDQPHGSRNDGDVTAHVIIVLTPYPPQDFSDAGFPVD